MSYSCLHVGEHLELDVLANVSFETNKNMSIIVECTQGWVIDHEESLNKIYQTCQDWTKNKDGQDSEDADRKKHRHFKSHEDLFAIHGPFIMNSQYEKLKKQHLEGEVNLAMVETRTWCRSENLINKNPTETWQAESEESLFAAFWKVVEEAKKKGYFVKKILTSDPFSNSSYRDFANTEEKESTNKVRDAMKVGKSDQKFSYGGLLGKRKISEDVFLSEDVTARCKKVEKQNINDKTLQIDKNHIQEGQATFFESCRESFSKVTPTPLLHSGAKNMKCLTSPKPIHSMDVQSLACKSGQSSSELKTSVKLCGSYTTTTLNDKCDLPAPTEQVIVTDSETNHHAINVDKHSESHVCSDIEMDGMPDSYKKAMLRWKREQNLADQAFDRLLKVQETTNPQIGCQSLEQTDREDNIPTQLRWQEYKASKRGHSTQTKLFPVQMIVDMAHLPSRLQEQKHKHLKLSGLHSQQQTAHKVEFSDCDTKVQHICATDEHVGCKSDCEISKENLFAKVNQQSGVSNGLLYSKPSTNGNRLQDEQDCHRKYAPCWSSSVKNYQFESQQEQQDSRPNDTNLHAQLNPDAQEKQIEQNCHSENQQNESLSQHLDVWFEHDNNKSARLAAKIEGPGDKLALSSQKLAKTHMSILNWHITSKQETVPPSLFNTVIHHVSDQVSVIPWLDGEYLVPPYCSFLMSDVYHLRPLLRGLETSIFLLLQRCKVCIEARYSKGIFYLIISYDLLSWRDIANLHKPLRTLMSPGCLVVVWITNKEGLKNHLIEKIFPKWSVRYLTEWYWLKVTRSGDPIYPLNSPHKKPFEKLIIGRYYPVGIPVNNSSNFPKKPRVIVSIPCSNHSRKPPLGDILKKFVPKDGTCLEMFARNLQPGWYSWGNEVLKFQHIDFFKEIQCKQTACPAHDAD
ncbi:uncharacterized protein LOC106171235 [Lingula anatina]|uniref:Uncharacterized protein LOC106171235 n=1 Tax=Lingula anatina TaxID=7574 RepID=A0A1S3J946_LINAN|nr:uncharacterized protein LOC106171235 [Lingula anatina]|eukprot:XP_013406927.1 uncharacterized protein LOC106171235 [Lingula anatina]